MHGTYPPILTVEQAAELLAMHPRTVLEHLRTGKIPGKKIGQQWRITLAQLLAHIEATEEVPA